jgi:hypothetical protein
VEFSVVDLYLANGAVAFNLEVPENAAPAN